MNKIPVILLLFVLSTVYSAAQKKTAENEFQKLVVSSGIQVQIIRSELFSVEIKTKEVEDKCLINTIEDGVLTLKLVSGFSCRGKVVVVVNCPSLNGMEVMGKAEVYTENVMTGDSLSIKMRSGGKAYLDMDIKYLEVSMSEGAMARLEGYAVDQNISASVSSTFSGWELEGDHVTVNAASSAIVKVNAQKMVKATAGSGGYIGIKGDPEIKTTDSKANGEIEFLAE